MLSSVRWMNEARFSEVMMIEIDGQGIVGERPPWRPCEGYRSLRGKRLSKSCRDRARLCLAAHVGRDEVQHASRDAFVGHVVQDGRAHRSRDPLSFVGSAEEVAHEA